MNEPAAHRRYDREGMYTIPIWIGVLLTGVYVLWVPRVDFLISETLEDRLAVLAIVGATLCLVGVFVPDRILAYKIEIPGLAIIFVVLGYLAVHVDLNMIQQLTMSGGLGAIIQIGNVRMIIQLSQEIRKDAESRRKAVAA